ncbi:MAG: glycoside hydrolase family 13 protein [Clostridia bacterium]|nr:glycoside hydrolase family 13 protein [Clostridia bacterium]NLS85736.1 glycoside hydrolase family 13 protein [Oscillospiraceae bacterium]
MSIYNSRDTFFKTPFGAVRSGEKVTFTLAVPKVFGCKTPYMILNRDGEAPSLFPLRSDEGHVDSSTDDFFTLDFEARETGLYFYYFDLYTDYRKLFCDDLGEAYITNENGTPWQLTVYDKHFETPQHLKGGVIYQIFPDRFCEGVKHREMPYADRIYRADKDGEPYFWPNEQHEGYLNMDYYGGDLEGIRQKLDYLSSLGVTCIYLNPIFEAHSNHRYNTADYMKTDPLLGDEADFSRLCKDAKAHGIDIILDGVFSHTGSDSVYFNREGRYEACGAYQSEQSIYRKWYDFSPKYACGYRSWWGFETLPEVNEENADFRKFICGDGGVIDHWLKLGASGFRLDVADELPDDFIEDIRKAVKRGGSEKYLLGEVWEDATTKWSYGVRRTYLLGNGLDAVMNYPFKEAVLAFLHTHNARRFASDVMRICENYPAPALNVLMNFMSTHDTVRAITALAGEPVDGHNRYWQSGRTLSHDAYERGVKLLILAYALTFTLPGIPSIYYGDEIAMQGYKDPFNRRFFDWNSGEKRVINVIKKLSTARSECKAFEDGSMRFIRFDGEIVHFERAAKGHKAEICVNMSPVSIIEPMLGSMVRVESRGFEIRTE